MSQHGIIQGLTILALFVTVSLDAEIGMAMAAGALMGHLLARAERKQA